MFGFRFNLYKSISFQDISSIISPRPNPPSFPHPRAPVLVILHPQHSSAASKGGRSSWSWETVERLRGSWKIGKTPKDVLCIFKLILDDSCGIWRCVFFWVFWFVSIDLVYRIFRIDFTDRYMDLDEVGVFHQIFTMVERSVNWALKDWWKSGPGGESAPLCAAKSLEAETGNSPHLRFWQIVAGTSWQNPPYLLCLSIKFKGGPAKLSLKPPIHWFSEVPNWSFG